MWASTTLAGILLDWKYEKATGKRIVVKPSFFNSAKSVLLTTLLSNMFGFHVCSSHETLMPLSKLCALLKSCERSITGFGLLFAILLLTIISSITKYRVI